jgi:hypothetical protein
VSVFFSQVRLIAVKGAKLKVFTSSVTEPEQLLFDARLIVKSYLSTAKRSKTPLLASGSTASPRRQAIRRMRWLS